jgi:hypothetical protein
MAEERTKYKAMIRYMARTAAAGGNPDEVEAKLSPEWLASMAKAMKENPLAPTRLDRRFPNVNQANNCWCVAGCSASVPRRRRTSQCRGWRPTRLQRARRSLPPPA